MSQNVVTDIPAARTRAAVPNNRRRPTQVPRAALGAILAAALTVASCGGTDGGSEGGAPTSTTPTDQRLRVVSDFMNDTFPDPAPDYVEISYGNAEMLLAPQLGDPTPWLAKSVDQQSDTVWRITLNPNITFQNGRKLDATALKEWFEYEFVHDPAAKGALGDPTAVTVVDPLTVDVTTPKLFTPFKNSLANYIFAVYDAGAVAKVGKKFEKLAGAGIFTGPYAYAKSSAGSVTYERYAKYWRGTPAMAGIDARKLTDQNAGLKAIANGEADLQLVPAVKIKRASARYDNVKYLISDESVVYAGFNINPRKAPFTDVKVRRAFAYAFDADAISQKVMDGVWRPLAGIFPTTSRLAVDWRIHDPDRAKRLLEEAGWRLGDDGVRTKDGARLTTEIVTYTDDLEAVGSAAIDMLRTVGFDAKLRRVPEYSPIPKLVGGSGPVNVNLLNLESFGLDGNPFATVCRNFEYDKGYNDHIRDDEMNELCGDLLSTTNRQQRDQQFRDLQRLNGERAYYVPIVDEPTTMVASSSYRHLKVNGFYLFLDWQTRPQG